MDGPPASLDIMSTGAVEEREPQEAKDALAGLAPELTDHGARATELAADAGGGDEFATGFKNTSGWRTLSAKYKMAKIAVALEEGGSPDYIAKR